MLELHTEVFCSCGARFKQVITQGIPPCHSEKFKVNCPTCGQENKYGYEFAGKCDCGKLSFDHFAVNLGNTNAEYFPRNCKTCNKEFILTQRRTS